MTDSSIGVLTSSILSPTIISKICIPSSLKSITQIMEWSPCSISIITTFGVFARSMLNDLKPITLIRVIIMIKENLRKKRDWLRHFGHFLGYDNDWFKSYKWHSLSKIHTTFWGNKLLFVSSSRFAKSCKYVLNLSCCCKVFLHVA